MQAHDLNTETVVSKIYKQYKILSNVLQSFFKEAKFSLKEVKTHHFPLFIILIFAHVSLY